MSGPKSDNNEIQKAIKALGNGPLEEHALHTHINPLFSHVLRRHGIYLANHSLGRALDQTRVDVLQAVAFWYEHLDEAWEHWLAEIQEFRQSIAQLIRAPSADCIVPKTSAGQGLRAILNCYEERFPVVTTSAEFNSIDHILKVYAQRKRISLECVPPDEHGVFHEQDLLTAIKHPGTLLVVSQVLFTTGQYFTNLSRVIREAQARGARILVDLYHAAGVTPLDIEVLGADFAIGGCYKYLRGGPGACWLYLHPRHLTGSLSTLDTGWFAQPVPFDFTRPESPAFASGGNAFLESTPPILPYYQAKAGLALTLGIGVDRLREYSLKQQARLTELLRDHRIYVLGAPEKRGAFLTIAHPSANDIAQKLKEAKIIVDAREGLLRICPDILTKDEELVECASALGILINEMS